MQALIFSSSASIYGPGADLTVDENSPIDPQSPYARTKAVCEAMFTDTLSIRVLSLRYFNPIGADPRMRTGPAAAKAEPRRRQDNAGPGRGYRVPDHQD